MSLPPLLSSSLSSLQLRILSALLLAPMSLGLLWYGGFITLLFISIVLIIMTYEWTQVCTQGHFLGLMSGCALALALTPLLKLPLTVGVIASIFIGSTLLIFFAKQHLWSHFFLVTGALYLGGAVLLLRILLADIGFFYFVWLLVIVCASDIGAYFTGRWLGGPKLAPRISPNKTWSGLIGGTFFATLAGTLYGLMLWPESPSLNFSLETIVFLSTGFSLVSHAGDLLLSRLKRFFHVKDYGSLIPGHGGFLDRIDSLLAVIWVNGMLLLISLK